MKVEGGISITPALTVAQKQAFKKTEIISVRFVFKVQCFTSKL